MDKITHTIYDLFNLNYSTSRIANHLLLFHKSELPSTELTIVETFVVKTLKDLEEEFEADAYLSSMECYYDNYCEY